MMTTPVVEHFRQISIKVSIVIFSDLVVGVGDPQHGPWVEVSPSGCVRRFDPGDQIVGGYAWVAQRVKVPFQIDFHKDLAELVTDYLCYDQAICWLDRSVINWKPKHGSNTA